MKASSFTTAALAVLFAAAGASAQSSDYAQRETQAPYIIHRHSSTFEEGVLNGESNLWRSVGDYNYSNSLAAINREVAREKAIENRVKQVQAYFETKEINRVARAAARGPRMSSQQLTKMMQKRPADRLGSDRLDRTFNVIYWPPMLQDEAFANERAAVEQLFSARTVRDSGEGSMNHFEAEKLLGQLRERVNERASELGAKSFVTAKRFVDSLQHESSLPMGVDGVAVR